MVSEAKKSDVVLKQRSTGGRVLEGVVVRVSGEKTVSVEVTRVARHRLYGKRMVLSKRFLVHDPEGQATVGQAVRIREARPISKRKKWTLISEKRKAKNAK